YSKPRTRHSAKRHYRRPSRLRGKSGDFNSMRDVEGLLLTGPVDVGGRRGAGEGKTGDRTAEVRSVRRCAGPFRQGSKGLRLVGSGLLPHTGQAVRRREIPARRLPARGALAIGDRRRTE